MVRLDVDSGNFLVQLDKGSDTYQTAFFILKSLLCYRYCGNGVFSIDYDDFLTFKEKLNKLGVKDRLMSTKAKSFIDSLKEEEKFFNDIKKGSKALEIKKLLSGKLKSSLYQDQLVGVSYLLNKKKAGLFDAMGIGKTIQALATLVALGKTVRRTLVICPKSVIYGFSEEIKKHTYFKSISLPSEKAKACDFLISKKESDWDILLVNPESLIGFNKEIYSKVLKELIKINFDMVIIDEWHQYKNFDTKRSKCVVYLLDRLEKLYKKEIRIILMTGTHISESPLNAYNTLKVLSCNYLPNISKFEDYFIIKKEIEIDKRIKSKKTGKFIKKRLIFNKVVDYKNLAELKRRIEKYSLRRTKDDMSGFPDKIFITRNVVLSGKQKELYKKACNIIADGVKNGDSSIFNNFFSTGSGMRLRQFLNHPAIFGENCESAKYNELNSILEEILSDKDQKIIIWTEFRKAVDLVYDKWNDQYGVIKLYSGVEINDSLVSRFENDEKPKIVAAIPAKGGTGVDFLARARTAIYLDRPCSLTNYRQSIDRIHRRVKQENLSKLDQIKSQPATIIFLDAENTIDELVRDKLDIKGEVSDAISITNEKLLEIGRTDLMRYLK